MIKINIILGAIILFVVVGVFGWCVSQNNKTPLGYHADRILLEQGDYAYLGADRVVEKRPLACSDNITMGNSASIDKFNNRFMFLKP